MVVYENHGKIAFFNKMKFVRDDKTGYYLNSTKKLRLHRAVWIYHNGDIEKGFHIHHKDHDKNNNDIQNLILINNKEHHEYHGAENANKKEWLDWSRQNLTKNARPKASEWHGSKNGKEWHNKHYEEMKHLLHQKIKRTCDNCNIEFMGVQSINRFCSNKCKSAWRRKNNLDNVIKNCELCGEPFESNKYRKARFCSRKCAANKNKRH